MLRKALKERANNHNARPEHDGPSTPESLGYPWRNRDTKDRAELVTGIDKTEEARFDRKFAILVDSATTKV
jgi:hypothetical protein